MSKWSPNYKAQNYQLYNLVLYPAIICLLFFLIRPLSAGDMKIILLLGLLSFVSEMFTVRLPISGIASVGFSISFAALLIFGPLAAMIVELFGSVTVRDVQEKTPWYIIAFNAAQLAFSIGVAGLVYRLSGGIVLAEAQGGFVLTSLGPISLAIIAYFLVSTAIISTAIAYDEERPWFNVWLFNFKWTTPNYLALGLIGLLIAQFYHMAAGAGSLVVVVFLPMLLAARAVFRGDVKVRDFKERSVKVFAKAVEIKDNYTSGHSERVADYATRIARDKFFARKHRVREHDLECLRFAGYLHDIGKIGIPKGILTKAARLTNEEYEKIKEHPELGALILKHMVVLKDVLPGVLFHHEKVDGRGYTKGLRGDSIPMIARVLAVADAFDAMTSERPYRPRFTEQAALDELFAGIGSSYDRSAVETLARVLDMRPSWEQKVLTEVGSRASRGFRRQAGSAT